MSCFRRAFRTLAVPAAAVVATLGAAPVPAQPAFTTVDRFVPHVSTVPANEGKTVGLFVREKHSAATAREIDAGDALEGRVVLFVHGMSVPSIPDFDLPYRDYSWMAYLAEAGYDTFAMDHTGYGHSPRPAMNDPCNTSSADQDLLIPNPLPERCAPSHAYELTSSATDLNEIDSVVDYVRELRGVERVSLIGWSLGGARTGGYAARHPDKIDKLIVFAPVYRPSEPAQPEQAFPAPGVPMTLQTHDALMNERWGSAVACDDQVEPAARDAAWRTILSYDSFGSVWGPRPGVMRVRTARYWGWNEDAAARVQAPTLIMVGRQDGLLEAGRSLYDDLAGAAGRVLVEMECATHFAIWEASQYKFMHEASRAWLDSAQFRGSEEGRYTVGFGGVAP